LHTGNEKLHESLKKTQILGDTPRMGRPGEVTCDSGQNSQFSGEICDRKYEGLKSKRGGRKTLRHHPGFFKVREGSMGVLSSNVFGGSHKEWKFLGGELKKGAVGRTRNLGQALRGLVKILLS